MPCRSRSCPTTPSRWRTRLAPAARTRTTLACPPPPRSDRLPDRTPSRMSTPVPDRICGHRSCQVLGLIAGRLGSPISGHLCGLTARQVSHGHTLPHLSWTRARRPPRMRMLLSGRGRRTPAIRVRPPGPPTSPARRGRADRSGPRCRAGTTSCSAHDRRTPPPAADPRRHMSGDLAWHGVAAGTTQPAHSAHSCRTRTFLLSRSGTRVSLRDRSRTGYRRKGRSAGQDGSMWRIPGSGHASSSNGSTS